jgi:cytochrome b
VLRAREDKNCNQIEGKMGKTAVVKHVRVWDVGVRIFHWSLVAFFALAYLTGEVDIESLHSWAGYTVIGLLAFRLVWGLIGTRYARFSNFIYGPKTVKRYAKSLLTRHPIHYTGHNPLGGWMVIALLLSLAMTSWTGLKLYAVEGKGPLADNAPGIIAVARANDNHDKTEGDGEEFWEEVHEVFSHLSLILIFIHVGGVVVSSIVHRENLVRAMVTGYKDTDEPPGNN